MGGLRRLAGGGEEEEEADAAAPEAHARRLRAKLAVEDVTDRDLFRCVLRACCVRASACDCGGLGWGRSARVCACTCLRARVCLLARARARARGLRACVHALERACVRAPARLSEPEIR